jgi:DNA polymerase-3 subunit delta'
MDLIIHPSTKLQFNQIVQNSGHALIVIGSDGIGKTAISQMLITALLDISIDKLGSHPYYLQISPESNTISIDTAREIKHFFELKTIGTKRIRRCVLIEHAECLTVEAQNALLKTIEEPPLDSIIVLTVGHEQLLLPTIISRLQRLTVHRPKYDVTEKYFSNIINNPKKVSTALAMSNGLPGLMHAILFSEEHPLLLGIEQAKSFLKASRFTRLTLIDEYAKQKENLLMFLQALLRISESGLQLAAQKQDNKGISQWGRILNAAYKAEQSLLLNTQSKLVLNNLIIEL